MRSVSVFLLALLVVFGMATESLAVPIEVSFAGVIEAVDDVDGLLPSDVVVGTSFSGTYTFDSEPAGPSSSPVPGVQAFPADPSSMLTVSIGTNVFSVAPTGIVIADNVFAPAFSGVVDSWNTQFPGFAGIQTGVSFFDATLSRISDPAEYFVNASLAGWTQGLLGIFDSDSLAGGGPKEIARGVITSIQIVPEPGTALLVGIGLVVLASAYRSAAIHSLRSRGRC